MRAMILCVSLFFHFFAFSQSNSNIDFIIKDNKNASIKNVEIRFLNYGFNGQLIDNRIVFKNIPRGNYTIQISAEGYASLVETLNVNGNAEVVRNLSSSTTTLDDIIVSSDKKETKYFKTSGSSTVLDAKQIRNMRLWELTNLSGIAPNLTLSHSGDNRNVTGLRGIVTTSYEQSVATYIDGVAQFGLDTYIPQLNEIESIEIMRGAQGTLFGRNAMGGIINITTKKPTNKTSFHLDVQTGSKSQQRYNLGFQRPLIKNKLFLGLNALHDRRNGFYTNTFTQSAYDKQNQTMIGLQLKYLLDNDWSIQADVKEYFATNNGAFPLVNDRVELFANPYQLSQNLAAAMKDKTTNSSLVIKHRGEKIDFTLQSSRQKNYRFYENSLDADFSPADIVGIFNNYGTDYNTVNVITNEARLQSKGDSKLEWIAGIYHFLQESPTKQATAFGNDAGLFGVPDKNFSIISTNIGKNNGLAGYGNFKYLISEKLSLIAGLRVDNENRKLTVRSEYQKSPTPAFVISPDTTGKTSYAALSPRIGLQYSSDNKHTSYISYSRGFRSGGLTGISSDPSQLPLNPFKPEYANLLEAGFKGENENKSWRYGISVFYNMVNDIQTPFLVLPDAVTIIKNGGKLQSKGVEIEFMAKPIKGFTLQYSGGYTDASYSSLQSVSNGSTIDLKGKKQIFTPSTTNFIAAQYQKAINNNELSFRLEFNHFGKQYFDFANTIEQKAYGLLNMRISYRTSHFDLSVWGRNLSDRKYIDYAYDFGAAHLGNPRMIGVGFGYRL
jgi:iron complex outermembrane receptor protein